MSATSASTLGQRARRIVEEHERQAQRLVAELAADDAIGLRGAVALVEQQIEHVKDAMHALGIDALDLRVLAEPRARTLQALVNGLFALEESERDLPVLKPQSVFSARTSCDSAGIAGSAHTKRRRRTSSLTSCCA